MRPPCIRILFFFNDTATTEIYTLSLHDALPICCHSRVYFSQASRVSARLRAVVRLSSVLSTRKSVTFSRSEEHTSELQSHLNIVCRLLLEKKKQTQNATANGGIGATHALNAITH